MKMGVAVIDVLTGQNAALGILAALQARERTGRGQRVEVTLFDTALAGLINVAQAALVTGREPKRHGNAHPTIVPYQAFAAADRLFVVAVGNDGQFQRLCRALGRDDLPADPRFATNPGRVEHREELTSTLAALFRPRPAAHWLALLEAAQVPCAPVQGLQEALAEPGLRERGGLWTMTGPTFGTVETVASPLRLSATPARLRRPAPGLGDEEEGGWEE
jgi:crotonobetainyl-CoA:carnitine CoA-transferase CaiB-like acyl-CoA transferase